MKYSREFRKWLAEKRREHRDEVGAIDALSDAFTLVEKLGYERAMRVHPMPWVVEAVQQLYEMFVGEREKSEEYKAEFVCSACDHALSRED
jgi:hypothetical protein